MGEGEFRITHVHGDHGGRCMPQNKSQWGKWEKMHSTSQESMEKMGEDAFHITKVHGEMGEDAFHKTKVHGENGRTCIPHHKSPWRKW